MKKIKLSIIIPAFNEEKRISKTLKSIQSYLAKKDFVTEILVVNDGSWDRTVEVVKSLGIQELVLVNSFPNRGKGYAVHLGVEKAQGDYILFMDADNSTKIDNIEKFLEEAEKNEVVIASRYVVAGMIKVKQPFYRRWIGRGSNLLIQRLVLPGIQDTQCGFKLFQKDAAKKIFSLQTIFGWGFDMEILTIAKTLGYKIKELPVDWYNNNQSRVRALRAMIRTFEELVKIKKNQLSGRYSD